MKTIYQLAVFVLLSLASIPIFAQSGYQVYGTVTNEKGEPLKGATVFIGGSERIIPTDENGRFNFGNIPSGNFKLSVQMLGFAPYTQNIVVKNEGIQINVQLKVKPIDLEQVNIGRKKASEKNLKLFTDIFLGQSANARQCVIVNPEIINFSTTKGHLLADADDFLIIENKRLGYRLHYLLKSFDYSHNIEVVLYHGDCNFEELDGTEQQKKQWAKNRLETYKGSLMHFLRSVHDNNTIENGFITRPMYGYGTFKYEGDTIQMRDRLITRNKAVMFDSLLTAVDTNFVSLKFKQALYVTYDPKEAAYFTTHQSDIKQGVYLDKKGSVLKLVANRAIIDKKGSYTDYRDFFMQGYWASARVGDQLPVEYKPATEIPAKNLPINPLLSALQKWTDSIPQEKAYLHLDKPYYAIGDTLWFKGYLTKGRRHQLSDISGAAYVDLIDDQNKAVKTLKLPVDSGTVAGNFILDEDLKAGPYRLRAYTQWMRNAGEDYFYDETITIGDPKKFTTKPTVTKTLVQTDVQFFPESGNLVSGINSRVAFKAVGPDGLGQAISGTIVDNENNPVAQISTLHAGMGNFLLKPLPGKTYTAHIKFTDSTSKNVPLPKAVDDAYVLGVYQPNKDSVLVRIQASAALQHSTVNLIVHSGGELVFSSPVAISSAMTSVWLDKQSFPGGIAQFTIFDTKNEPVNERIAFIKNGDNMQLAVKPEKTIYASKEHVVINIAAKEGHGLPVGANFSVAVIDETKVPVDESSESTIFSNILLTSDIKGYIEKPNYYFMADTDDVNKALDNLMLTQGYRRFEWKALPNTVNAKPAFKPENIIPFMSGTVTDLQHHLLPNANILLVSTNARITRTTTTNDKGHFTIDSLVFPDSAKFAIQARTTRNTSNAIITLDSIPKIGVNIKPNLSDIIILKNNFQKAAQAGTPATLTGLHVLKQVEIKAQKITVDNSTMEVAPQGMIRLPDEQSADQIITIQNPEQYPNLLVYMQAAIPGTHIEIDTATGYHFLAGSRPSDNLLHTTAKTPKYEGKKVGVVLDGRALDAAEIDEVLTGSVLPEDVAKIDVVRTNQAMLNFWGAAVGGQGFILIFTKPATMRKHYDPNIVNIMPKGYNKVREFYSPHYDLPNGAAKVPDNRTTIYWNPYVNTDNAGKACVDFYNADGPGKYRVVIEGIDAAGELGRQVYHYKVE